jgi:hypothetical protein
MTSQYRGGIYFFTLSCVSSTTRKNDRVMAIPTMYPRFKVIEMKSPSVSPRVVATTFISQKRSVIFATLFNVSIEFHPWLKKLLNSKALTGALKTSVKFGV